MQFTPTFQVLKMLALRNFVHLRKYVGPKVLFQQFQKPHRYNIKNDCRSQQTRTGTRRLVLASPREQSQPLRSRWEGGSIMLPPHHGRLWKSRCRTSLPKTVSARPALGGLPERREFGDTSATLRPD